jgi:hypothetical protein
MFLFKPNSKQVHGNLPHNFLVFFLAVLTLNFGGCGFESNDASSTIQTNSSPAVETSSPALDSPRSTWTPSTHLNQPDHTSTNTVIEFLATKTPTNTQSPSSTPTITPTETQTTSPTITATYAILRGRVIPDRANCRYGPGASYLYKYGLVGGSNLEIIGRSAKGTWILIRAIGGDNPCWVKAELMEIKGDILSVEPVPVDIIQAWSPYYPPLTAVSATRNGEIVTVFWSSLVLRPGDDSEQVPYIIEAWVCQDEELVFIPVGSYGIAAEVRDESGCIEPSHGQVIAAEKHGYTWPVEVLWPTQEP